MKKKELIKNQFYDVVRERPNILRKELVKTLPEEDISYGYQIIKQDQLLPPNERAFIVYGTGQTCTMRLNTTGNQNLVDHIRSGDEMGDETNDENMEVMEGQEGSEEDQEIMSQSEEEKEQEEGKTESPEINQEKKVIAQVPVLAIDFHKILNTSCCFCGEFMIANTESKKCAGCGQIFHYGCARFASSEINNDVSFFCSNSCSNNDVPKTKTIGSIELSNGEIRPEEFALFIKTKNMNGLHCTSFQTPFNKLSMFNTDCAVHVIEGSIQVDTIGHSSKLLQHNFFFLNGGQQFQITSKSDTLKLHFAAVPDLSSEYARQFDIATNSTKNSLLGIIADLLTKITAMESQSLAYTEMQSQNDELRSIIDEHEEFKKAIQELLVRQDQRTLTEDESSVDIGNNEEDLIEIIEMIFKRHIDANSKLHAVQSEKNALKRKIDTDSADIENFFERMRARKVSGNSLYNT